MFCLYLESNSVHYVIIGAGPAAVAAAEKLRVLDGDGQVTMIGACLLYTSDAADE